jgi:hypothetical protein
VNKFCTTSSLLLLAQNLNHIITTKKSGKLIKSQLKHKKIPLFQDVCLQHLSKNLSITNLFECIAFAYQHKITDLKPLIMEFVAEHLHLVTSNPKWKKQDTLTRLEIMEGAILFQQASTSNASINGWFS